MIESLSKDKDSLLTKVQDAEFQIKKLQNLLFNRKTEKLRSLEDQESRLFNEAELFNYLKEEENAVGGILPGTESKTKEDKIQVATYSRKKPGRTKLPDFLPRIVTKYDLPEDEQYCPCGCKMTKIGEESSEKADIIPQKIIVNVTVRSKYACKSCKGNHPDVISEVKMPPLPPQFLPKAVGDIGLISHSIISKFCDGLPFYRLSNIYQRYGLDISRGTLCNYVIQSHEKLKYVDSEFWREIKNCLFPKNRDWGEKKWYAKALPPEEIEPCF